MSRPVPTYPPYPDEDLYFNAFSRTTGRIVDLPVSQFARVSGIPTTAPFQGSSLVGTFGSPLDITGTTVLPIEETSQFPPLSFTIEDDEVFFNQVGSYRVNVSGAVAGTPGVQSSVTITAVPTGTTAIISDESIVAVTSEAGGTGSFSYPFLANVTDAGSDLFFTATTFDSNVSILNGAIDIVKVT